MFFPVRLIKRSVSLIDLSKVLFIATANSLNTIQPALLDRMEIIRIPGYTEKEKYQIAKKYLAPKQIKNHGLKNKEIVFSASTLNQIIRYYTREAGVRNLEKEIAKVCRKAVKILETSSLTKISLDKKKIEKYLGGLKDMGSTPQAIFVVDVNKDAIAVSEANKLKIPVIGILDTNSSPIGIDYPIPGNDDSRKSIELICSLISKIITKNKKKINFKENIVKKKLITKIPKKEEVKRELKKEKKTK